MHHTIKRIAARFPPGIQQDLKRWHLGRQIRRGIFESPEPEFKRLGDWVAEGDWALDLGANVGHYTARLSALVGETGHVIALEPVPETFELLVSNMARLGARNVSLLNLAASDAVGMLAMTVPKLPTGLDNYYRAHVTTSVGGTSVVAVPLDSIGIPARVRLVKVDVEGHELAALEGLRRLIQRDRPILIVEGRDEGVAHFLRGWGYHTGRSTRSPNQVFLAESTLPNCAPPAHGG